MEVRDGVRDLRGETPVGSVNLTERDLSEAVADWVLKRYGFKAGVWEATLRNEVSTTTIRWECLEVAVKP